MKRELIPDAFRMTAERTPTGSVVLRQDGDKGESLVIIPAEFVKAVVQGIYDVATERIA